MSCAHAHVLKRRVGLFTAKSGKISRLFFALILASDRAHCWRQRLQVSVIHSVLLYARARDLR